MRSTKRIANLLLLGYAALQLAACADKMEGARHALDQVSDAVTTTSTDATKYVPEQMAALQREMANLEASYDEKDYAKVMTGAPAILADAKTVAANAQEKKEDIARAVAAQWSGLSTSLPQWITLVKTRINSLSKIKRVPKDINLGVARSAMADADDGWERAQAEKESGEVDEAVATAKDVKAKTESAAAALNLQLPAPG
jgi:hypothetical protein